MHLVVIHGWKEASPELLQALAVPLGIMVYEMRQRMIGGGPAVVAGFAEPQQARAMAAKLGQSGVLTLVIDSNAVRSCRGRLAVRRFELNESFLRIYTAEGPAAEIQYKDISLLLSATSILGETETVTVSERKFSLGKTILSGGIPLKKTVIHQEEVSREERGNILYLYTEDRPPVVFSQGSLAYDGFGPAMKLSRELNFAHLKIELRRLSPGAGYDDRLQSRLGQVRLLGPGLSPEKNLDCALEILALSLGSGCSLYQTQ